MYDYFLGGAHNFDADRQLADRLLAIAPEIPELARSNRSFLRRAVRWLCAAGIDQFIDIGSGIPTAGNVHEVARQANPASRVVYVDIEPVAVAHAKLLLGDDSQTAVLRADLREPASIMDSPEVSGLIDLRRPVALLMVSMLHFVTDDERPAELVAEYRGWLAPGSYLVVTHATANEHTTDVKEQYKLTPTPIHTRSREAIGDLLAGFDLVPPGLVVVPEWHPDTPPTPEEVARSAGYGAIGKLG
jgi:S-adenosyl methyltransferase